jgi:telomere length regulation protein
MTHLLLLSLSLLPRYDLYLISLSHRSRFLLALQSYLAHPDPSIRRLGMLVAEVLSELTIEEQGICQEPTQEDDVEELKARLEMDEETDEETRPKPKSEPGGMRRLRFGKEMWDGEGQGKEECRWLRRVVGVRDGEAIIEDEESGRVWLLGWDDTATTSIPPGPTPTPARPKSRGRPTPPKRTTQKERHKIVMLTDEQLADSLKGYSPPSPSSSRSPSPTPSYLEEIASDPSLALDGAQKKKVTRPVYIGQLAALLKEREKPEYIEMGLKWGEGLIRAKRSFGTELGEQD